MHNRIKHQLTIIEKQEQIKILYAVEAGSRAWGINSTYSDFDVRFIYIRPQNEYLKLNKGRDVIEYPLKEQLDLNGWDLDKALKLLYSSNPTFFEWCYSPIVYKTTPYFEHLKTIINDYFSITSSIHHYLNMAKKNYKQLSNKDMIQAKAYFYILRPILSCLWILQEQSPPPVLFNDLVVKTLKIDILPFIDELIIQKQLANQVKPIKDLNDYIESSLEEITKKIKNINTKRNNSFDQLNQLFLEGIDTFNIG